MHQNPLAQVQAPSCISINEDKALLKTKNLKYNLGDVEPDTDNFDFPNKMADVDNLFKNQNWVTQRWGLEPREKHDSLTKSISRAQAVFKNFPNLVHFFLYLSRACYSPAVSSESKKNIQHLLHETGFNALLPKP